MNKPCGYSYCVDADTAGRIYAGEYPVWEWNAGIRLRQLRLFLDFGIDCFVDLTEEGEMPPYKELLPAGICRYTLPIPNLGTPKSVQDVVQLFETIRRHIDRHPDARIYIHCLGGVGRTGTIVSCYYIYFRGMSCEQAVAEMRRRYAEHGRSEWMSAPETQAQIDFIKTFANIHLK